MLQERGSVPQLRRADDFLPLDHDFAADRRGEAGPVAEARPSGVPVREYGMDAEAAQRPRKAIVDHSVAIAQRSERRDRRGDGVRHFVLVPDGATAGRASHHVEAEPLDSAAVVSRARRLVSSEGEARRRPAVQSEKRGTRTIGLVEQRLVQRHVLGARAAVRLDDEAPGQFRRQASAYASSGGHTHIKFRSPYAPSMRLTAGQILCTRVASEGNAARSRE